MNVTEKLAEALRGLLAFEARIPTPVERDNALTVAHGALEEYEHMKAAERFAFEKRMKQGVL